VLALQAPAPFASALFMMRRPGQGSRLAWPDGHANALLGRGPDQPAAFEPGLHCW